MSVYKPKKGRFWHYDFQLQGVRHHGSTGATTRTKAERVEEAKRFAAAKGDLTRGAKPIPTLGEAATIWWESKSHRKSADQMLDHATQAVELVGRSKPVNEVTYADVHRAIQKRRGMLVRGKKVPSNCTVNRVIIATIRPIIALAREQLNDGVGTPVAFPEIKWGKLRLPEPKPRARDFSPEDIAGLIAALPEHFRDFARFKMRYGCRLSEMFFPLSAIDIEGARLVLTNRKGGDDHVLPLMDGDLAMLAARVGRARKAGIDTVWFRQLAGGRLKALSYSGTEHAIRDAMEASGLRARKRARGAHDLRHHAGMTMLRKTGNLRVTQKLLGHANVQSTLVYAHALEEDLRDALDKVSRPSPEPSQNVGGVEQVKSMSSKGN